MDATLDERGTRGYDIIGDVHGCAAKLEALLVDLGYRPDAPNGAYRHPLRTVIFVGDLIDRGPEQLRVLEVAKAMADAGTAQVVMGNHEFNAIAYATESPAESGNYLRPHTDKNDHQHRAFLEQLSDVQRAHYLDWFMTLPLWLDLDGLRVVHACWHPESVAVVQAELGGNRFTSIDQLVRATTDGEPLYQAIETLLKGPELSLTEHGQPAYRDKDGQVRTSARVRWWGETASSLGETVLVESTFTTEDGSPYPPLNHVAAPAASHSYGYDGPVPVFFGHYWRGGTPEHLVDWTARTACLDFSAVKGEALTAYRWSGESEVRAENFVQRA
ncbi:hypothetical protein FHR72_001128 [Mycolicibacterium iranicum]|uniref:Calcineurin-like phosphoesterase domain-containing protein n=1 Tax=Mycolicibacterium iranicum TaxID=912594 RepID=A0A839Q5K9_MYCIR|nr:metallophosphoesterase [Mycolicibacterium iranicum]MBB2989665.1 hypothetical protein [Mycolicibacterium iranicum]